MPNRRYELARRRTFLKLLAGSPMLGYARAVSYADALPAPIGGPKPVAASTGDEYVIASPDQAINVFEFETVARQKLSPAHYGILATGVDDEVTLRANREALIRLPLRPRRLVDVRHVDMTAELFGVKWKTPIALAPIGTLRAYHPDGELATAKAAGAHGYLQILSTVATTSVEDVIAATGGPVWFQLYPTSKWTVAQALVKRAELAGCPVVVLTVDLPVGTGRKTDTFERLKRLDPSRCADCHELGAQGHFEHRPMFDGLDLTGLTSTSAPGLTWSFVARLRETTSMKVVVKGILTREDANLCLQYGVDGVIVSNHGGRAEDSGLAAIDALPEVVEAVQGRIPVLVDGGFRRGTDVFKGLALGAQAICIGRPYIWGLAAFGQPGVERVLEILRVELELIMKQCGTRSLKEITPAYVGRPS
ncbi:MAG TPA: alpha-hydroxy acid oxidase [Burkholderiales bacterium]|nr:alpha-hydroxy acid oxidase [Burkholderiales bacterium]